MVPFHVTRGDVYAQGLKAGDVVVLEDGHPRGFSIFEGPDTQRRIPVELIPLPVAVRSASGQRSAVYNRMVTMEPLDHLVL